MGDREMATERVESRDGKIVGKTTGASHSCTMEGCNGKRISVLWEDGKRTRPCSKGMEWLETSNSWRII
jgi:hypothetical protein